MEQGYRLLQVYHTLVVVFSNPFYLTCELSYDRHYLQFKQMLDLLESLTPATPSTQPRERPLLKLSFSFDLGVVLPLFVISIKCRDPKLRRRAIARLYSVNRREGLWDSLGAAKVAETIMNIEEEGLGDVQSADQIGQERRVHETFARINVERREIQLRCTLTLSYEPKDCLVHF